MADQLHFNIRDFRDILLAEIAKLEHGVREQIVNSGAVSAQRSTSVSTAEIQHERELKKLRKEVADLTEQLATCQKKSTDKDLVAELEAEVEKLNRTIKKNAQEYIVAEQHYKSELIKLRMEYNALEVSSDMNYKQLLQSYVENEARNEALKKKNEELEAKLAQVQAEPKTVSHPLLGKIQEQPPIVNVKEELDEEEEEGSEEGVDPESLPNFKHKGVVYKKDTDGTLYKDSDDGWELVGRWDEGSKSIVLQEIEDEGEAEAEAEAEDDEENNLTEFVYKGKTYFLDEENNVFQETDDGYEQVGKYNGKKIILE